MSAIILWLSRHAPTPRQVAELERMYPGHTIKHDKQTFGDVADIVRRFHKSGATDLVLVAPWTVVRELVKRGLHPLWAEMKQVVRGSPLAESHHNGRSYRFVGFRRVDGVELKLSAARPLTSQPDKETSDLAQGLRSSVDAKLGCNSHTRIESQQPCTFEPEVEITK